MTACYVVVFADGFSRIYPAHRCCIARSPDAKWFIGLGDRDAPELTHVWHCPSPVEAARLLADRQASGGRPLDIYAGCTLICRNAPAPEKGC